MSSRSLKREAAGVHPARSVTDIGIKDNGLTLLATIENMKRCKDIPGVVALDSEGNEFSANPGDYFWLNDKPLEDSNDEFLILAVKVCKYVDPITREDI